MNRRDRWVSIIQRATDSAKPNIQTLDLKDIYIKAALHDLYQSLPNIQTHRGDLRLIHLQPGTFSEPLACTFSTASIQANAEYEALSYTWRGSASSEVLPNVPVRLNGVLVYVLPNLGMALRRLRNESRERILWIDFLCINQANLTELSEQVEQMALIYQSATQVVIFLGDEMEGTDQAVQLLLDLGNKDLHFPELLAGMDLFDPAGTLLGLITLLQCDWFSRVWTIQESIMARHAVVQRGGTTFAWEEISRASQAFHKHLSCCQLYLQNHSPVMDLFVVLHQAVDRFKSSEDEFQRSTLRDLLARFRGQNASNPRDHVYSLLGLLEPSQRLLRPDYSLSSSQVFIKTALEIIKAEESLEYLTHIGNSVKNVDLPSWVPDPANPCSPKGYVSNLYRDFDAAGCRPAAIRVHSEREIILKGIFMDTVSDIGFMPCPLSPTGVSCQREAHALYQYLLNIELMAKSLKQQHETEKSEQDERGLIDVWGTAVMGVISEGQFKRRRLEPKDHGVFKKARSILEAYAHQPATSPLSNFFSMIDEEQVWEYCLAFTSVGSDFRFFLTEQQGQPRRMGMGPIEVLPNDRVVILAGGRMPFILRRHSSGCRAHDGVEQPCYALVGLAYVDGIMDGVVDRGNADGYGEWEDIYLR